MSLKVQMQDQDAGRGVSPWFQFIADDQIRDDNNEGIIAGSDFGCFYDLVASNVGRIQGDTFIASTYESTSSTIKMNSSINSAITPGGFMDFHLDATNSHALDLEMSDLNYGAFSPTKNTGGWVAFECSVALSILTSNIGFFCGLMQAGTAVTGTKAFASGGATLNTAAYGIGIVAFTGGYVGSVPTLKLVYQNATGLTTVGTISSSTVGTAMAQYGFIKLGFGLYPAPAANKLVAYVNGQPALTKADVGADANWPDNLSMAPYLAASQPGSEVSAADLWWDWAYAVQKI